MSDRDYGSMLAGNYNYVIVLFVCLTVCKCHSLQNSLPCSSNVINTSVKCPCDEGSGQK